MNLHDLISPPVSALGMVLEEKLRQEQKCDSFSLTRSAWRPSDRSLTSHTGRATERHALLLLSSRDTGNLGPRAFDLQGPPVPSQHHSPSASIRGASARILPALGHICPPSKRRCSSTCPRAGHRQTRPAVRTRSTSAHGSLRKLPRLCGRLRGPSTPNSRPGFTCRVETRRAARRPCV